MAGISKLSLVLLATAAVAGLVPGVVAEEPKAAVDPAVGVVAEEAEVAVDPAFEALAQELEAAVDPAFDVVDEDAEAAVDPAFGADEVQEVVKQQASLRGAADTVGEVEVEAQAEVDAGSCRSGLVGRVYKVAPACMNACSYTCGPLSEAINAYLTKGGRPAAKKVVCRKKWAFACPLKRKNSKKCRPLIRKASGFGLPTSIGQLNRQCR
jgi:hypothetical protein